MKQFNIRLNIGMVKYSVAFHDGVKTYGDGSPFFDLAIFANKRKLQQFVKQLRHDGYKEV